MEGNEEEDDENTQPKVPYESEDDISQCGRPAPTNIPTASGRSAGIPAFTGLSQGMAGMNLDAPKSPNVTYVFNSGSAPTFNLTQQNITQEQPTNIGTINSESTTIGTGTTNGAPAMHAQPSSSTSQDNQQNRNNGNNRRKKKPRRRRRTTSEPDPCKKHLDNIRKSVNDMVEIETKNIKGCETLKSVKELPILYAVTFDDFTNLKNENDQYNNDMNLQRQHFNVPGKEIDVQKLHSVDGKIFHHVMVCGNAGQGKSSLLRYYSKEVNEHRIKAMKDICLVVFFQMKNFVEKKEVFLQDFITGHTCRVLKQAHKEKVLDWMVEHDDKILFVFDGIDEFAGNLSNSDVPVEYFGKFTQANFIRAIFSGEIFPESKILSSTREYAIKKLPSNCYPDQIVTLRGFTRESIDKIVSRLCENDAPGVLAHLKDKGFVLYTLCSTPFYLILVVAVIKNSSDNLQTADTVTSLLLHIIVTFLESSHRREDATNFRQVTKLAFYGMKIGKVVFVAEDLKEAKVTASEIEEFTISSSVQCESVIKKEIVDDQMIYSFPHKIMQEIYCAMELLHFDRNSFSKFVQEHFGTFDWENVRLFTYGIIFNTQSLNTLKRLPADVGQQKDNSQFHGQTLLDFYKTSCSDNIADISFIQLLYESPDVAKEMIRCVKSPDLNMRFNIINGQFQIKHYNGISPYNIICLKKVFELKNQLLTIDSSTTLIDETAMQQLLKAPKIPQTHKMVLNAILLSGNTLARIAQKFRLTFLSVLQIQNETQFDNFVEKVCAMPSGLQRLELRNQSVTGKLGKLVNHCKLTFLRLENCNFLQHDFNRFCDTVTGHSQACDLVEVSFIAVQNPVSKKLAQLLNCCKKLRLLGLQACNIKKHSFTNFLQETTKHGYAFNLQMLNLTQNPSIAGTDFERFLRMFAQMKTLHLNSCIEPCDLKWFSKMRLLSPIQHLFLIGNNGICSVELAVFVANNAVKELVLNNCKITTVGINAFMQYFTKEKQCPSTLLNVSHNTEIVNRKLGEFVSNSTISRLIMGYCIKNEQQLVDFCEGLKEEKTFEEFNIIGIALTKNSLGLMKRIIKMVTKQFHCTAVPRGTIGNYLTFDDIVELQKAFNPNIQINFVQSQKINIKIPLQANPVT